MASPQTIDFFELQRLTVPSGDDERDIHRLKQLEDPCRTPLDLLLMLPLDQFKPARKQPEDLPPFPLTDIVTNQEQPYGNDWQLFVLRHRACILNERYITLGESLRKAWQWYAVHQADLRPGLSVAASIPLLKGLYVSICEQAEKKPSKLPRGIFSAHSHFLLANIAIEDPLIGQLWRNSITPHTAVVLALWDEQKRFHRFITGYTIDNRPPAEFSLNSEETKKRQQAMDDRINLRLSDTCWCWDEATGKCTWEQDFPEEFVDWMANNARRLKKRIFRLESFLMDEYALLCLDDMAPSHRRLLLHPVDHAISTTLRLNDYGMQGFYDRFSSLVNSLSPQPQSPQQLLFILQWLIYLLSIDNQSTKFQFIHLGGSPGTGKSATLVQAALCAKTESFVDEFLPLLREQADGYLRAHELADLEDARKKLLSCKITYVATTNDAVDEGCQLAAETIERLASQASVKTSLKVVRICNGDRLAKNASNASRFIGARAAESLKRTLKRQAESAQPEHDAAGPARIIRDQERREAVEMYKKQNARREKPLEGAELTSAIDKISVDIRAKHADACKESGADYSAKDKRLNKIRELTSYISVITSGKGQLPLLSHTNHDEFEEEATKIIADPSTLACLTAGFVNPYHNDVMEALRGSVVLFDEATQSHYRDLFSILNISKGLVLAGDSHQLGNVLKCPSQGVIDAKAGMLQRSTKRALWLTLCYRLHPNVTQLLQEQVYHESGLFSPTGQNILRISALHLCPLFKPTLMLDVPYGRIAKLDTSKYNEAEVAVVAKYLGILHTFMEAASLPPIRVNVVSPYLAQAEKLKESLQCFADLSSFSAVVVGTIETVQGASTDLCICSTTMAPAGGGTEIVADFMTRERATVALSRAKYNLVLVGHRASLLQALPTNHPLSRAMATFDVVILPSADESAALLHAKARAVEGPLPDVQNALPCTAPLFAGSPWANKGESTDSEHLATEIDRMRESFLEGLTRMLSCE